MLRTLHLLFHVQLLNLTLLTEGSESKVSKYFGERVLPDALCMQHYVLFYTGNFSSLHLHFSHLGPF